MLAPTKDALDWLMPGININDEIEIVNYELIKPSVCSVFVGFFD